MHHEGTGDDGAGTWLDSRRGCGLCEWRAPSCDDEHSVARRSEIYFLKCAFVYGKPFWITFNVFNRKRRTRLSLLEESLFTIYKIFAPTVNGLIAQAHKTRVLPLPKLHPPCVRHIYHVCIQTTPVRCIDLQMWPGLRGEERLASSPPLARRTPRGTLPWDVRCSCWVRCIVRWTWAYSKTWHSLLLPLAQSPWR